MAVTFRTYDDSKQYGSDYQKIRSFLMELDSTNYHFGRWDWMISHSLLEKEALSRIGIWEESGSIVGIATYDTMLDGNCLFPMKPEYGFLHAEMIAYAENRLSKKGIAKLLIRDGDTEFQNTASKMGYVATHEKESDAIFDIDIENIHYSLPEGFSVTSMKDTYDLYQYGRVLWKGFNHEAKGEGAYAPTPDEIECYRREFERPNVNLDIKIAVTAPDGNFASYCGMWHDPLSDSVLLEPVATDPMYRKMGLGRAVVLEAVRRCMRLGAKRAYVGSSQQFYYRIGFSPISTSTFWSK